MQPSIRLLNFASILAVAFGIVGKLGHLFDGSLFLALGILGASTAYILRLYYKRKGEAEK